MRRRQAIKIVKANKPYREPIRTIAFKTYNRWLAKKWAKDSPYPPVDFD